jgi:hypothetical protein
MAWNSPVAEIRLVVHTFTALPCLRRQVRERTSTHISSPQQTTCSVEAFAIEAGNFFISAENPPWIFALFLSKLLQ